MRTGGIMPHSGLPEMCSYGSGVSVKNDANGWAIRVRSFFVAVESAGSLVTNGDGVSGIFEVGEER